MSKRVLVVDDDENTVKFLSLALRENGYEPFGANDGREGYDKVKETEPDLIVLDVMMPKRSGFVLFKQLRKDPKYKQIPVIMLTAVSGVLEEQETRQDASEKPYESLRASLSGAIAAMREEGVVNPEKFVDKPIDPEDFIVHVREIIGR